MRLRNIFFAQVVHTSHFTQVMQHLDDIKLHIIIGITLKYKLVLPSHELISKSFFLNSTPLTSHINNKMIFKRE